MLLTMAFQCGYAKYSQNAAVMCLMPFETSEMLYYGETENEEAV